MRTDLGAAALFLIVAVGCGTNPLEPDPTMTTLRSTPTAITLGAIRVELHVSLNRDFMPLSPPDGRPLTVLVQLPEGATGFVAERVWVLFGQEVWSATPERGAGTLDWVARDGPKWGPGVAVDVVARLRHPNGNAALVRAANQVINASF